MHHFQEPCSAEKQVLHRLQLHTHNTEVHLSDTHLTRKLAVISCSKISIRGSTKNEFSFQLILLDISIEQYVIYFYWMYSSLEILMYNEVTF